MRNRIILFDHFALKSPPRAIAISPQTKAPTVAAMARIRNVKNIVFMSPI